MKAALETSVKLIVDEFWRRFDAALEPKRASKRDYLEALEDLCFDAESRIECVKDELADEE